MATRDHLGRDIGVYLQVSDIAQKMQAPVQSTFAQSSQEPDASSKEDAINRLYSAVNEVASKIDQTAEQQLEESRSWTDRLIKFATSFHNRSKSDQQDGELSTESEFLGKIAEATQKLWHASQSQNTIWVGICKLTDQAQKDIASSIHLAGCCGASRDTISKGATSVHTTGGINSVDAANRAAGGGGGRGNNATGNSTGDMPGGDGEGVSAIVGGAAGKKWLAVYGIAKGTLDALQGIHSGLVKMFDIDPMKHIFTGVIAESNNFRESLRALIHMQKGFGAENAAIENEMRDITAAVDASGVRRLEFQRLYIQNLQRGYHVASADDRRQLKSLKLEERELALLKMQNGRMESIQTTALNTASMLNMGVDSTNELFMDWHYHLSMSALDLGVMGRHMQGIARNTGVTGDRLERAMKNADIIIKKFKQAGTASTDAMKNVTEIMALAEKYGVSDSVAETMTALSSRTALLEMDPRKAVFLRKSAATAGGDVLEKLQHGALGNDREGIKALMEGSAKVVQEIFAREESTLRETGVLKEGQTVADLDISNLSEVMQTLQNSGPEGRQVMAVLQRQLESLGTNVGDVEQTQKLLAEFAKTPAERMAELNAKIEHFTENGMQGLEEFSQMQKQLYEMQTNNAMDGFAAVQKFSEQIKNAGGVIEGDLMNDIVKSLTPSMGANAAEAFVKNLEGNANELLTIVEKRATAEGRDLNKLLAERGVKGGINEARERLAVGDEGAMLALQESMQLLRRKEQRGQDPMTEIRDKLMDMNNTLGDKADSIGFSINALTASVVFWGGFIASILGEIVVALVALKAMSAIGRGIGGLGSLLGPRGPRGGPSMPGSPQVPGPRGTPHMPGGPVTARPVYMPGGPVVPNVPDPGRTRWAGQSAEYLQRPSELRDAKASRADRITNANKYLGTRQAAGQSGRATFGGKRRGILGIASRGLSLVNRHRGKAATLTGAAAGAGLGYYASDGDMMATAAGAMTGGALGYGAHKLAPKSGGLVPTPVPGGVGGIASPDMMSGMPGWGGDAVPVYIVGGMENMGLGGIGAATGRSSLADTAFLAADTVDTVADVASMTRKADKVDDVVKAGRLSRALSSVKSGTGNAISTVMSKVPGASRAANAVSSVKTGASGVLSSIGTKATGLASSASKTVPLLPSAGSALGTAGRLLGRVAAPVGLVTGGILGGLEAEDAGRSTASGVALGALTGGANTGSMFSGALGIQAGSAGDEAMGILGSAGYGAATGAAIGSIVPGVGTLVGGAVGGAVGATAEVVKIFTAEESALRDAVTSFTSSVWDSTKTIAGDMLSAASEMGGKLWNGISEVATGALQQSATGFAETGSEQWKAMMKNGSSFGHAAGGLAGGATDLLSGDVLEGSKKIGASIVEGLSASGAAIKDGAKAVVGSKFNPLNWFSEGTREIEQGGVAVLHPGEMVIPKAIWEQIKAVGSGPFGSGKDVKDSFGKISSGIVGAVGATGNPIATLVSGFTSLLGSKSTEATSSIEPNKDFGKVASNIVKAVGATANPIGTLVSGFTNLFTRNKPEVTGPSSILTGSLTPSLEGAFAKGEVTDANDSHLQVDLQKMPERQFAQDSTLSGLLNSSYGQTISKTPFVTTSLEGAFEKGEGKSATDTSIESETKKMFYAQSHMTDAILGPINAVIENFKTSIGSMKQHVGDALIETHSNLKSNIGQVTGGLGFGLFDPAQSDEAQDASTERMLHGSIGVTSADLNNIVSNAFQTKKESKEHSDITTNLLDYRDQIRGEVGTLSVSRATMENMVERDKYGESPTGGSTVLPSMEAMTEYLTMTQAAKLDEMIGLLAAIRNNTSGRATSQVVTKDSIGAGPPTRPGVKNIARDHTKGFWDLTFGDYSPGAVTTEGRGGSA